MSSNCETDAKKPCGRIGTHDGGFHCDEALACFMLKLLPQYKNAEIVRTRDPIKLDTCDIVVDVGGTYDPSKHRYDHHQRSFEESFNSLDPKKPWKTKLSSAGLVYVHFGKQIIAEVLKVGQEDEIVGVLYDKMYEHFIEEVDAIDNGINICDGEQKYLITTNLSSRVRHFYPAWNDANQDFDVGFYKALDLVGAEFVDRLNYYHKSWWPARMVVKAAIDARHKIHSSGEIIEFTSGGCPWKEHLLKLEQTIPIEPKIKFVLFPDQHNKWRVQGVPPKEGSFDLRVPLHETWQGLRADELCEKSGIPGCIFCHATGFIGGNATKEGALQMATLSLKLHES